MRRVARGNRWAGLSLMESIVVVGVMTVVMFMVIEIFTLSYTIYQTQARRTENESGAIIAANTISRMARGASSVEASYTFGSDTITSSATALVIKLPSIDGSGNIIEGAYDYMAFYRDGTETSKIFTVVDANASSVRLDGSRLITDHNQRLDFRYNAPIITGASRVSIYVQNHQAYKDTDLTTTGWTSIFMRNF